jgi:pimeloyl-ACP methyl ester carboxylesterase
MRETIVVTPGRVCQGPTRGTIAFVPRLSANGLEIEYESIGDPASPPLLMVSGLGAQLISWDDGLCQVLAGRGFHVIRFDNRDVGLSSRFDHLGVPELGAVLDGRLAPAYTLDDMADDTVGLLDALGIDAAHVMGASMGGFIAQMMAIRHRPRVLSLTSVMSAPGGMRDNVAPTPAALEALLKAQPTDREALIEHAVWVSSVTAGPEHFDREETRQRRTRAIDRAVSSDGTARQLGAVAAAGSRLEALAGFDGPALVIQGEVDPLLPVENGRRTAGAIPGCRLLLLPTAGHDLPRVYWPTIADAVAEVARRADSRVPARA